MKRLLILVALATLSACASGGEQQSSLNSSTSIPEESSLAIATGESSTTASQSSSESSLESSSDDKIYHLVSIYQSYPRNPDSAGDIKVRFEMSLQIEDGKPLYSNDKEMYALTDQFKPDFIPHTGAYSLIPLFYDVECTTFYIHGTPITSDSTFYYYMAG
jgi:hypothetical protein